MPINLKTRSCQGCGALLVLRVGHPPGLCSACKTHTCANPACAQKFFGRRGRKYCSRACAARAPRPPRSLDSQFSFTLAHRRLAAFHHRARMRLPFHARLREKERIALALRWLGCELSAIALYLSTTVSYVKHLLQKAYRLAGLPPWLGGPEAAILAFRMHWPGLPNPPADDPRPAPPSLSDLPLDTLLVIGLVAEGLSDAAIALKVGLPLNAVRRLIAKACRHVGCSGKQQLALWYAKQVRSRLHDRDPNRARRERKRARGECLFCPQPALSGRTPVSEVHA